MFKANMKVEALYNLLVAPGENSVLSYVDSRKIVIELGQKFLKTNNFYRSYKYRTITEMSLAFVMLSVCAIGLKYESNVTKQKNSKPLLFCLIS